MIKSIIKYYLLISIILIIGCATVPRYKTGTVVKPSPKRFVQYGYASYYGKAYHNKRTASGEIFDMNKLTAAHRSLPFFTKVKVTNLENGKSVIVYINDRGPFVKNRIIDLSYAAAKKLDMLAEGVVKVKIEVVN